MRRLAVSLALLSTACTSDAVVTLLTELGSKEADVVRLNLALVAIHADLDEGYDWKTAKNVASPHAPKFDALAKEILKVPSCGHIVFCDNIAVHRWLVMLLVAAGFPKERIAIINGSVAKDPVKRLAIADKFNGTPAVIAPDGTVEVEAQDPEYDVVICNMAAYEGIDLHLRTCRVYHLDLPWEPNTLRQRNGRAIRQGNRQAVVEIKFLLARKSLDVVRLEYVLGKLRWMSDLIQSADNQTSKGRALNRRVDFRIIDPPQPDQAPGIPIPVKTAPAPIAKPGERPASKAPGRKREAAPAPKPAETR